MNDEMGSKPFWASKTMWVNAVGFLATISVAMGWDLGLTETVQMEIVVGIWAVANIILRFVTKAPIGTPGA